MHPPLQNPKYASDVNMPSQTKWRNVGWKTSTFFIQRLQTFFFVTFFLRFLTFFIFFWNVFYIYAIVGFLSRVSILMHAERDIVLANLSVRLYFCPSPKWPILYVSSGTLNPSVCVCTSVCSSHSDSVSKRIFLHLIGTWLSFFGANTVTTFQGELP